MENFGVSESISAVPSTANDSVVNVAITTMANSEVSPQLNKGSDVQSLPEFRSAAFGANQLEHQRDEVFSETPQPQLHAANGSQTVPQNTLQSSRELKSLGSVNNAGRKESLAISESSRQKCSP